MKNLMILVKMQLKEQLNFNRTELSHVSLFRVLLSTIGVVLKFALVTALCGAFLIAAKTLGLFSLTHTVPSTVVSLVFSVMLAMSILSCTIGITKAMYFSRDNAVLLTLPCLPIQVYLSKLVIFFIFELKRNLSFIVPLFIAYFYTHGYSFKYYPWLLVCILFVSLFTVAVGSLLSIPGMWLSNIFRRFRALQVISLVVVVGGAVAALFFGISLIPENIDLVATWGTTYWKIQDFLVAYASKLSPIYDITLMMLGETRNLVATFPLVPTLLRFLKVLGVTVVSFGLGLWIVRPLFYKMASKPFEHVKKKVKPKRNHVHSRVVSAVWVEVLVAIKGASRIFSNVGIFIAIPMLTYLLNKIFLAMNTREMGNYMVVAFNLLIILLVALNSNFYASSIYSRDGRSSYLIKTQPSRFWPLLVAKLVPNTVFVLSSLIVTFVLLLKTASLGTSTTVMLMISVISIYLAHLLYCAELDLMNPQIELYATVGSSENNVNETKATISAFLIAFGVAAVLFLLMIEGSRSNVFVKLLLVSLIAVLYRGVMFFSKIKLYYKEK